MMSTSSSGHPRLFEEKRNSNIQKNISQYNGRSKNESTPNSANSPDQTLVNSQDLEVEQLKNNELMKQGNIVQQKRNSIAKTNYLNKEAYLKQPAEIKRKKCFELERNKEKEHGPWSDKRTELGPAIKSGKIKNGRHYVFTSCNRETCRKNVGEHNLNTEKLTEIINNSIKEAIQAIVKETPNILRMKQDSLLSNKQPLLSSNSSKKPENNMENPGGQIKSLVEEDRSRNSFNDFHKKTYPLSVNRNNIYENQRISSDVNFIKNNAITPNHTIDKCNKITCPYLTEKLEAKSNKIKRSMKSLKKPLKHSATTDNRKMTGNVNIYICSEAGNEKEKQESRESGSVTNTETDINASVSTISSNKLIANLLERRRRLQNSSLQCLCRKSETILESRIEEVPQEENHLNDVVTGSHVPPALDPVSNYETAITSMDHENDIKNFEKSNTNFDRFNNNGGDHSCTALNCPHIKERSIKQRNFIKNNYPRNIKWCTKNNSITANGTVDDNCSCAKTISPYLFRNGSVTSVKQSDVHRANNIKRKDRLDRKWQESEIEEVCIYCTPRRCKKLEQCPKTKLNNMLKKCIKGKKQRESLLKNIGTSQKRNCAEQCSISNSALKEEIEVNNTNLNEEDLPEKIDSQRKEAYVASSYGNNEKASVDKSNVKDDVTILSAKSELGKSSFLLSSINYDKKYQDKPFEEIGSEADLSEDKDQSHEKYISNTKLASPVIASSIITSPSISNKRLDTVTTQEVRSASRSVEQRVIMEEDKLTSSVASAPFSKIKVTMETEKKEKEKLDDKTEKNLESKENQKLTSSVASAPFSKIKMTMETEKKEKEELDDKTEENLESKENQKLTSSVSSAPFSKIEMTMETEKKDKEELDDKTEENLESKENQKESLFQRVVKRVKQFIGLWNVLDNMNDKKKRGCGSSCRALPRNFVNDGDVEDQFPKEDAKEYNLPVISSSTDKSKNEEIETTQETILTRQSSKDVIISQDKMKDDGYKVESPKDVFNINKENASKAKLIALIAKKKMLQESNKNNDTIESNEIKINKDTLETREDAQVTSSDVTSVTKANESKSSKNTVKSITERTEESRRIQKYNSAESKNLESFRSLRSSNNTSAKDSQIIKDTKSSKDTVKSITDRIEESRIKKNDSAESKNLESFRSLKSSNNTSPKDSQIIKDTKSSKDTVKSITDLIERSRRIKKYNSAESKNLESFRSLRSSNKISEKDSRIIKDTEHSVTSSKDIETQKSLTNSLKITIPKDSKNLDSPKVSSNLKTAKESVNLQVSEDSQESSVSKNEDNSVNCIKNTKNSESASIEDDDIYHDSYTEFIQSKSAQQIDHLCNCKEPEKAFQVCIICCCPEDNCSCNNRNKIKTMICVNPTNSPHCDNPHERCTCQNPVCNCFHHKLTKNNCNCNCNCDKVANVATCNCNMNNNVSVQDDDNMIYVTAWKPTKDIEKYFSRTLEDFKNLPKEYCCFDNKKPYGSEELPYQRLGVFSKVMTELQEKINQSVTCKECENAPCRCVFNASQPITREMAEDKTKSFDQPGTRSQSASSCKCTLNTCNSLSWKPSSSKVNDRYKSTSCYCRQSRSAQCRSRTKCFYCKCSPCRCTRSRETSRSRSCKCDNSLCHYGDIALSKMTDTNLQISKNFQCLCTPSRDPCSF